MIERQPYLPRFMAGGEGNPLGARALYLGDTLFRIHGTNQPSTIGTFVSSGCIRLTNDDITDLYRRVKVGTRVVVLSANGTPACTISKFPKSIPTTSARIQTPNCRGSARTMRALQNRSRFWCVEASGLPNRNRLERLRIAHCPKQVRQIRDKDAHREALENSGRNEASPGSGQSPSSTAEAGSQRI